MDDVREVTCTECPRTATHGDKVLIALADYEREMTENGIPEIIAEVRKRGRLAHEARQGTYLGS